MEELQNWLQQVHFLRPLWLLALLPAAALLLAFWLRRRQAGEWRDYIAPHLLRYLIEDTQETRKRAPFWGLLALWTLAIIALAGPAWKQLPEPVQKSGAALVIAWDMSPSMMAQDVKPSRLVRSRLKLVDLLRERKEGATGLVAYAAESHVVTPLTDDTATIISLLPALTPDNMPAAGSNPEMALRTAYRLLNDAGVPRGNVLIITDEIVPEAFDRLAQIRRSGNHQVTIWGVGTPEGAPIPLPNGGFARDRAGKTVIAKLNEDALQDFAADIDAYYVPMLQSDQDIETLQRLFDTQPAELRETDRVFDAWYEHGPWLLLLVLPLAALAFRRGWLMVVALVVLPVSLPQPAHALSWQDLWKKPDQQGQAALEQDQPDKAAELFESPSWRGTALYRTGDYEAALQAFQQAEENARNFYNRGNALMQLGEYEEAIEAYDAALERDPQHQDAQANKALAEKLLQQQQQQQQSGQDQQQGNQGDTGDQQQEGDPPQDGQPQENQGDQNGDQQEGEGQPDREGEQAYDDPTNNTSGDETGDDPSEQPQTADEQSDEQPADEDERDKRAAEAEAERQADEPEQAEGAAASAEMSEAEREQQQALEQWLRQVPDDPGGLLRNKFLHEYRERRRTGDWQVPGNDAGQRW